MLPRAKMPARMAGWRDSVTATRPSRLNLSTLGSTSRTVPLMASLTPDSKTSTFWPGSICGSTVSGTAASNSISPLRIRKRAFGFGDAQIRLGGDGLRGGDLGLGLPRQQLYRRAGAGGAQSLGALQRVSGFGFGGLRLGDRRPRLRDRRLGFGDRRGVLRQSGPQHGAVEPG